MSLPEETLSITAFDLPGHAIVHESRHGLTLYKATGSVLAALLQARIQAYPALSQTLELDDASWKALRGTQWLSPALRSILFDDASPAERGKGPARFLGFLAHGKEWQQFDPVEVRPEWRQELILWLFEQPEGVRRELEHGRLSVERCTKAWGTLSFLELARARVPDVVFVDDHLLYVALDARRLTRIQWKASALGDQTRTHKIFARYLQFFNEVDTRWDLLPLVEHVDG